MTSDNNGIKFDVNINDNYKSPTYFKIKKYSYK